MTACRCAARTADERREEDRENPDGREGEPGPHGGIAEPRLEHHGHHDHPGEIKQEPEADADCAHGEVTVPEQREVDHGMLFGELPRHKEHQPHDREDAEDHDVAGGEPVLVLALVEHELEAAHADDEEDQPHGVDGVLGGGRLRARPWGCAARRGIRPPRVR